MYLTIGNIPEEICQKPCTHAYVLLAYLPTTKLMHVSNKAQCRWLLGNLYHTCMEKILKPLEAAGKEGIFMTSGDGKKRRNHLIFASFIGNYPEQILTTGAMTGECPTCTVDRNSLGDLREKPGLCNLDQILKALDTFDTDPAGFLQTCSEAGIKPIIDPFWKDLLYAHNYCSINITPDILHQLYQGVLKHLMGWVIEACGAEEIDARCRRMPPNHNICLFLKGITSLSRVTGQEHDQMCRILLGLVIDARLGSNISNCRLIHAVRALLDFLYLAQYPIHTNTMLELLEDALKCFHANKDIFVDLGLCDGFNISKLHFASHYSTLIKLYGTADNTNTEYTKRLHIDLAKDAYAATNSKDKFSQMTTWLERKEKMLRHDTSDFLMWKGLFHVYPTHSKTF